MKIAFKFAVVVLTASCSTFLLAAEEQKLEVATAKASVEVEETEVKPATPEEEGTIGLEELDLQAPEGDLKALPRCNTIEGFSCPSITAFCRCELWPGEPTICFCKEDQFGILEWQCI